MSRLAKVASSIEVQSERKVRVAEKVSFGVVHQLRARRMERAVRIGWWQPIRGFFHRIRQKPRTRLLRLHHLRRQADGVGSIWLQLSGLPQGRHSSAEA